MQSQCESSPNSLDECRLSTRWPPTLSLSKYISQLGLWECGSASRLIPSMPTISIYFHSAWRLITHFTVSQSMEGWVNLYPGTTLGECSRALGSMPQWLSWHTQPPPPGTHSEIESCDFSYHRQVTIRHVSEPCSVQFDVVSLSCLCFWCLFPSLWWLEVFYRHRLTQVVLLNAGLVTSGFYGLNLP